ncbi:MAG: flagellar hook-associated protein FlgK [Candidatus Kapabacteria bacterium]|nr:flagellar hook-associated protein FlgK [Candidatus Kapabacteria bacterium]
MGIASLEIGKRALLSQRFGLDVTSNNIANANTPGYSRREATFAEALPTSIQGTLVGSGVLNEKLRTFREEFFDKEVRNTLSRQASYEADQKTITRVESILAEPSEQGLNELSNKFLNSFDELALKPESEALRENVIGIGQTLVDRINLTARQLSDARNDTLSSLKDQVGVANKLITQIAELNKAVSGSISLATNDSQTMIDSRELKLEELTKLGNVNVTQNLNGTVNVFMNGMNVVTGQETTKIDVVEQVNPITAERTVRIGRLDKDGNILNFISPENGKLSSLMKSFNITLDDKDSTGNFSVASDLNTFVKTLAGKVNGFMTSGYGLDDKSGNPPNRSFFEPAVGTLDANNIKISSEILNKPRNIAISDKPNEPGNANIATKIARISDDSQFIGNSTPSDFYSGMVGRVGTLSQESAHGLNTIKLVSQQLTNQRDSIIGVNLDEEAVNLVKFQQAFQASSRVINTTNEILTTIVNLGR